MADQKVTDLLSLATVDTNDVMLIIDKDVDVQTNDGASRQVTITNLASGIGRAVLTANNSLMYRDASGAIRQVTAAGERDVLYRASGGTLVFNNGRNFLDNTLRGGTAINSGLNYQPHYNTLWQTVGGSQGITGTALLNTDAGTLGVVNIFDNGNLGAQNTGFVRVPQASAAYEGDRMHIFNRTVDGFIWIQEVTTLQNVDEDRVEEGGAVRAFSGLSVPAWRLYRGDFISLVCARNADEDEYHWYQCAGTPLENRRELFITETGLNFTAGNQYAPGEAFVRTTATGQTHTLPDAGQNRRYHYRVYMSSATETDTVTVNAKASDQITNLDGTTGSSILVGNGASAGASYVELMTNGRPDVPSPATFNSTWYVMSSKDAIVS